MKLYLGVCTFVGYTDKHLFIRVAWADDIEEARRKINEALQESFKRMGCEHHFGLVVTEAL
jgi:hypothetical protein